MVTEIAPSTLYLVILFCKLPISCPRFYNDITDEETQSTMY